MEARRLGGVEAWKRVGVWVVDSNEKTATMKISKSQAPHAHRSNVV